MRAAALLLLCLGVQAGPWGKRNGESAWRNGLDEVYSTVTECAPVLARLMTPHSLSADLKGVGDLQRAGGVISAIAGLRLEERTNSERVGLLGALAKASLLCYDGSMRGREYLVSFDVPRRLDGEDGGGDAKGGFDGDGDAEKFQLTFRSRHFGRGERACPFDVWTCSPRRLLVVAFRGSHTPGDWLSNLDLALSGDGAHSGFEETMAAMRASLRAVAREFPGPDWRVVFTGHSRGGALALLAAELFYEWTPGVDPGALGDEPEEPPLDALEAEEADPALEAEDQDNDDEEEKDFVPPLIIGAVTFGQPRVGDAGWCRRAAALLGRRYVRVVHAGDVVPRLPAGASFSHPELPYLEIKYPEGRLRWRETVDPQRDTINVPLPRLPKPGAGLLRGGLGGVLARFAKLNRRDIPEGAEEEEELGGGGEGNETMEETSIMQHIHVNYARNIERGVRRLVEERVLGRSDPREDAALECIRRLEGVLLEQRPHRRRGSSFYHDKPEEWGLMPTGYH